jgi:phosphoglycerate dehydrogenase-like enzyme
LRKLNVLFLPPPPHQTHPWRDDITNAVGERHKLRIYDIGAPLEPQFEGIEAVIEFGYSQSTRQMADLAAARVLLWQLVSSGYDGFDLAYWSEKKIPVANCPGYLSSPALADAAMMLMLMLARQWHNTQYNLQKKILYTPMGEELRNKQLLLIGFGASARELALRARSFGMHISAIDILPISTEEQAQYGLSFAGTPEDLDSIICKSDYISLHLHLNPATRHMIDARRLNLMKPTARIINVARGELLDQQALESALRSGRIAGAGLDVFVSEPVDPASTLLKLPNVIALPHVAGTTYETSKRRAEFTAQNVDRVASGKEPLSRVDQSAGNTDHLVTAEIVR